MKKTSNTLQRLVLAAAIAMPFVVHAEEPAAGPAMQGDAGDQHGGPGPRGGPDGGHEGGPQGGPQGGPPMGGMPHEHDGPPPFGPRGPGGPGGAPFMHGIELTEAQQDKIFAIHYAQEPVERDQHKIVEKSHEALHQMMESGKYDDAKAVALVQAATQAEAALMLAHLRTEQQLLAVLTPEQRKQMEEHKPGKPGQPGGHDGKGRPPAPKKDK